MTPGPSPLDVGAMAHRIAMVVPFVAGGFVLVVISLFVHLRRRESGSRIPRHGCIVGMDGRRTVAISQHDAEMGMHIIGLQGVGKTSLLVRMILQRFNGLPYRVARFGPLKVGAGQSQVVWDVFGDFTDDLLDRIPQGQEDRVVVIDPLDTEYAVGLNPLQGKPELAAEHMVALCKRLFGGSAWGPQMQDSLNLATLTLSYALQAGMPMTLFDLQPLLEDEPGGPFRKKVVAAALRQASALRGRGLERFWREWESLTDRERQARIGPLGYKLRTLLEPIGYIIGQAKPRVDIMALLDRLPGVLIVMRAPVGEVGEETVKVLGSLLVEQAWGRILGRSNIAKRHRRPVTFVLDECPLFSFTALIQTMLSTGRKYRLSLILAHQFVNQLVDRLVDTVYACRSRMVFACEHEDAVKMAKRLQPLPVGQVTELKKFTAAVRLMAHDQAAPALVIDTLPMSPVVKPNARGVEFRRQEVLVASQVNFASRVADVEAQLLGGVSDAKPRAVVDESGSEANNANINAAFDGLIGAMKWKFTSTEDRGVNEMNDEDGFGGAGGGRGPTTDAQRQELERVTVKRALTDQLGRNFAALRAMRASSLMHPCLLKDLGTTIWNGQPSAASKAIKRMKGFRLVDGGALEPLKGGSSPHGYWLTPEGERFVEWLDRQEGVKA